MERKPGPMGSVLNWLRKGYPNGVPTKDYFPLLALLSRRLTDSELDEIVEDLVTSGHFPADRSAVGAAIKRVAEQEPTDEDLSLVAARLAAAGWPLAGEREPRGGATALPEHKPDGWADGTARPAFLRAVLDWLRAGYPQGVPHKDYIPLLALLRRRLSEEETGWIAGEIVAAGDAPAGVADIGVLITKITNELPSEDDVDRVRAQLEATGFPLDPPVKRPGKSGDSSP